MRSTLYSNFLYALFSSFIYTTLVVQRSRILACASHFNFKFGTYISYNKNYILPIPSWNWLSDSFLFRFNLMRHIYVDYTNMSFYERLNFNPFCCTFFPFYYSIFGLVWLHIIFGSITYINFCFDTSILEYLFEVNYSYVTT